MGAPCGEQHARSGRCQDAEGGWAYGMNARRVPSGSMRRFSASAETSATPNVTFRKRKRGPSHGAADMVGWRSDNRVGVRTLPDTPWDRMKTPLQRTDLSPPTLILRLSSDRPLLLRRPSVPPLPFRFTPNSSTSPLPLPPRALPSPRCPGRCGMARTRSTCADSGALVMASVMSAEVASVAPETTVGRFSGRGIEVTWCEDVSRHSGVCMRG